MRKILFLVCYYLTVVCAISHSAPPVRDNVYIPLTTIRSNDVMANEDSIFSYLQNGVEVLAVDAVDRITEIDEDLRSGSDQSLITGTAGSTGHCAQWNVDGDLVTSGAACGGGGGSGGWTDGGLFLYPTSGESVLVGKTTSVGGTGNLELGATTSAIGQFYIGTDRMAQAYGTNNLFLGPGAGNFTLSGATDNMALGDDALTGLTSGDRNIGIGDNAGGQITTGSDNIFMGDDSGGSGGAGVTGNRNVGIGLQALGVVGSGATNVAIGYTAGSGVTTGSNNVMLGNNAGGGATMTASNNVLVGENAGTLITSSASNVAIGSLTLDNVTTAGTNIAIGREAGSRITSGTPNIAIGYQAIGGAGTGATGDENVAIGYLALSIATSAEDNIAIGSLVMDAATSAADNVAIGDNTMSGLTDGEQNIGIGTDALLSITTADYNTCVGDSACRLATTSENTALGENALSTTTTGTGQNTSIGAQSGGITTGWGNTFLGYSSGNALNTGNKNICLGYDTCSGGSDVSNSVAIGAGIDLSANNQILLGTSTHTTTIAGSLVLTAGAGSSECLQRDTTGKVTGTGASCGSGAGGSGTVNTGLVGRFAYYPSTTNTVDDATQLHVSGSDVIVVGDLTISGDDLTMATNTSGFILVADGTNYNPVAVSGDVTLSSAGAVAVAANSVALTTDTTGNYAAGDAEAGAATTGDSATAFFSAGTIEHERGGLEADVSGYSNGLFGTDGAATIDVDTIAEIETAIGGATNILIETEIDASSELKALMDDETGSGGALVFATAPTLAAFTSTGTGTFDNEFGVNFEEASGSGDNFVGMRAATTLGGNITVVWGDDIRAGTAGQVIEIASVSGNTITLEADTDDSGGGGSSDYIILNPGSASITGTIALVGDATQGAQIDGSNGQVLLFDATTDEGAAWRFRLPDNWVSHTDIKIPYSMTSATTGTVEFEIAIMCQSPGDSERDDADGFAAIAVASDTVPGTARFPDSVTVTPTDDSCAASDVITIFLSTDSDDGTNDTATGDRRVGPPIYEYGI